MKKIYTLIFLTTATLCLQAQSNSYLTIKDTFKGGDEVYRFGVSGFLCRTVLALAEEDQLREAITDVKHVRFIIIPKTEFQARNLTLNGFKKVLKQDSFEELAYFQDHGDYYSIFLQDNKKKKDLYFILVDEGDDIVAIELKGTLNVDKLLLLQKDVAMND